MRHSPLEDHRMRRFSTAIVIVLTTLWFISICLAQPAPSTAVPSLVRDNGTLKDGQGAVPSSTTVGVTFAIYKEQDGGAPLWQETHNITPDANGQYTVVLGSTATTGLPEDLFSQQEQRWLGVQIQGQAERARVLMVSVPYALKAHEAETLGGLPPSAFVKAPSNPSGGVTTDTGIAANELGTTAKAGSITSLARTTAAPGTVAPLNLNLSGLDFWGDPRHDYTATSEPSAPLISNKIFIGGDNRSNSSLPPIPFSMIQVGIATHAISPDSKLSIFDLSRPALDIIGPTSSEPTSSLARAQLAVATCAGCYSAVAVPGDVVLRADADINVSKNFTGAGSLILDARSSSGAIRFVTGFPPTETEKMTLLPDGLVGIGTTSPQYLLHAVDSSVAGIVARFQNANGTCDINPTSNSLACSSDERLKKNITPMGDYLARIMALRPVHFNWKAESTGTPGHPGFIAQQVQQVMPEVVSTDPATDLLSIGYSDLIPAVVSAIQQIQAEITALQRSLTASSGFVQLRPVAYPTAEKVTAMLLNELQKQHTLATTQQDAIKAQQEQIRTQAQQIQDLQQRLLRMESALENK
jgi:hypothetical protein